MAVIYVGRKSTPCIRRGMGDVKACHVYTRGTPYVFFFFFFFWEHANLLLVVLSQRGTKQNKQGNAIGKKVNIIHIM